MFRKAGDHCALRGIHDDRVIYAQSVIVVRDTPEEAALLLLPGAQCMVPAGWAFGRHGNGSGRERWASIRRGNLRPVDYTWHTNRFLFILEPERYYATIYIWQHQLDAFSCYCINFQLPFLRSHCGFDTLDLELDLVVEPTYACRWKDQDDHEEGIAEGGISQEWARGVERDQVEVLGKVERRLYPLDGSWLTWHPEPSWSPPRLPGDWDRI